MSGATKQTDSTIKSLVSNGINYLDSRLEFWRQQQPLYSRKKKRIDLGNRNRLIKGYPLPPTIDNEYTMFMSEAFSEMTIPSVVPSTPLT